MRSTHLISLAAAITLGAFALTGCGDDSSTGVESTASTDNEAIGLIISEDTESFGYDVEMNGEQIDVAPDGRTDAAGDPIDSFYFRRIILSQDVSRDIHISNPAGEPATAEVTVVRDLHGIFRLFYADPDGGYLPATLDKRLEAQAVRNALFMKRDGDLRHRGWRLVEVSGVEVSSQPTTKHIRSVAISSPSVNVTITDPLELVPVAELPTFEANEEVTVTVQTDDETDFVFLHAFHRKMELENLGGGLYQGTWSTSDRSGRRRAAIDVIDEDTLLTEDGTYDSVVWGFIYRIAGDRNDVPGDVSGNDGSGNDQAGNDGSGNDQASGGDRG